MFRFSQKNLIYLLIIILPFFLFFVRPHFVFSIRTSILDMASGPIKIISFPFQEIKKILYYHRTFDEYKRLTQEVNVMKARLIGQEEVLEENARLEKLLDFKRKLIYSSVAANVIGRDHSLWNFSMIIDKGKAAGLKQGFPVVNALGVVGKVTDVGQNTSHVMLLTDPQFSVGALVQRPRESGLVSGALNGLCRLKFLDKNANIHLGDKIITSKLSSSFPEGLFIGEIIQIVDNPRNQSIEAIVQPSVNLSQIEEVLVIIN